jgi:hypothetical protein
MSLFLTVVAIKVQTLSFDRNEPAWVRSSIIAKYLPDKTYVHNRIKVQAMNFDREYHSKQRPEGH